MRLKSVLLLLFYILTVAFGTPAGCFAQTVTLKGIVVDDLTNQPLSFATIGIRGSTIGTATNTEGRFVLNIPGDFKDSVLFSSYMGYKPFEKVVSKLSSPLVIRLEKDIITLDEVEVRPWSPWDYVWNAMKKIPENYARNPYTTKGYYSEFITENGMFLKFTEAVVKTWNPPYGTESELQSEVIKARRKENPAQIQFKRKKLEKKYEKEKKKKEKKGETWEGGETIDEEIISSSFGGPVNILKEDPLRDTVSFLNIKNRKKFIYSIDGYTTRYGEQVIIIGYKSKGVYEHQRLYGKIFISLVSDAILAVEYNSEIVIPALARPVLFVMGIGIRKPGMYALVQYRPVGERWYLNDFSMDANMALIDKKLFKKNETSNFHMQVSLINQEFNLEDAPEIPEDRRIDPDKPLEEQVGPDPAFWENYQAARPLMVEE